MNSIVLLHGALGASQQLEPLKEKFAQAGRKCYVMDFSGHHGKAFSSDGFGIEIFAADLHQFLTSNEISQADIFGYSMGGYVALWLAHQRAERIGKIVTLGTKFDWSPSSAAHEVAKMNPEKIEQKVPAFARLLHHRHLPNDWKELMQKTSQMMLALGEKPLLTESIFKSIKNEVTVLLGDSDDMADLQFSKQVASWLPAGIFRLLPETPHPIEKTNMDYILREFNRNYAIGFPIA